MVTVTPVQMTGIFADLANDFIAFKQAQGYCYHSEEKVLGRFCKFAQSYALETPMLSKELALDWTAPKEDEAIKSRMHRISCINQFGLFMAQQGYKVEELPPQRQWNQNSFVPYIFTHEEIEAIFAAAGRVRSTPQARMMPQILPVLLRMMYGTGMRVSEAVGLRCRDVDLVRGILTIHHSKNKVTRLIPLSESLCKVCQQYKDDVFYWAREDDFFFIAPDRTMLSPNTIYSRFRLVLWDAGIPYKGKGYGPRLHDLRHTFAVHTLQKWIEGGQDLTALLPVLSTYMGHKTFSATSHYLRLTAEVYPSIVKQVDEACGYVIPTGVTL